MDLDILVAYIHKYWNKLDTVLIINEFEDFTYTERKEIFLKGLKLNLDKLETDEKWSDYIVGRVFKNRKKTYYEQCIYWFLVDVYYVDMTTTKQSLYDSALKDIIKIRKDI